MFGASIIKIKTIHKDVLDSEWKREKFSVGCGRILFSSDGDRSVSFLSLTRP